MRGYSSNDVVGEDLSWYWRLWYFEFGNPDLAIEEIAGNHGLQEVVIRKVGDNVQEVK